MSLCIIPARGGSKRIPRKNIIDVLGVPMIGRTIELAKASKVFERIVVSTEDSEISDIARKYGAETPFVRDSHLADDDAQTIPVIQDAIKRIGAAEDQLVACLYPAALLTLARDLHEAVSAVQADRCNLAMAVAKFPSHPTRAFEVKDQRLVPVSQSARKTRTQDLPGQYYDCGQFYVAKVKVWEDFDYDRYRVHGIEFPKHRAIDIDTHEDLEFAKLVLKSQGYGQTG